MRRIAQSKILAFALCLCLATVFSCSIALLHVDAHHDCSGENCPVCAAIQALQQALKSLAALIVLTLYRLTRFLTPVRRLAARLLATKPGPTLQSLRVQFNE